MLAWDSDWAGVGVQRRSKKEDAKRLREATAGAKLAEEHYAATIGSLKAAAAAAAAAASDHAAADDSTEPAAKRQRRRPISKAVLDKAPSSLQSCRSLHDWLKTQLKGAALTPPAMDCPKDMRPDMEALADGLGRLAGFEAGCSVGGARARRAFDLKVVESSAEGKAAREDHARWLEERRKELSRELLERGEKGLEVMLEGRRRWAQDDAPKEVLRWCCRILHEKEESLLLAAGEDSAGAVDATEAAAPEEEALSLLDIYKAMLSGSDAPASEAPPAAID
eukprot:TRINITY_DN27136_c0_g1_i1.p1 TRINITY_DN27136_c0_g1~~TRINITY_DN27136_c0_g1_i1.p1  ORF type:complete len:280 (+),score=91.81 TRINITY_DN27136_c0_g1_i1:301-1140(+)